MPLDGQQLNCRGWAGLRWDGGEVAILASGPSMTAEQADAVRSWRDRGTDRFAIAINTTFKLAPWANVIYACDGLWWEGRERSDVPRYVDRARETGAQLWTQDVDVAKKYGLNHIKSQRARGISRQVGVINQGDNGGFQAVGLAYQSGVARAWLLGFDMRGGHWHGPHPGMLQKNCRFDLYLDHFSHMANDLPIGFSVVNCTPGGALECFPRRDWREVFA